MTFSLYATTFNFSIICGRYSSTGMIFGLPLVSIFALSGVMTYANPQYGYTGFTNLSSIGILSSISFQPRYVKLYPCLLNLYNSSYENLSVMIASSSNTSTGSFALIHCFHAFQWDKKQPISPLVNGVFSMGSIQSWSVSKPILRRSAYSTLYPSTAFNTS